MFGTNVLRGPERGDGEHLWVQALFPTIQGEGPLAGTPALFLRLAGCNLRCTFCDTDFETSEWRPSLNELMRRVTHDHDPASSLVVITGGEPLRQNVVPLVDRLLAHEYRSQCETAGTLWVPGLEDRLSSHRISFVCSPKTGAVHPMIQRYCKDWKYIVSTRDTVDESDGLPIACTQEGGQRVRLARPPRSCDTVWLQPCEEYNPLTREPDALATRANERRAVGLCRGYGHRLSLQLHKHLGLP
jgi:7-carboxy-7-deazaguanine synthase